ncbi:MAG: selenoneine biosynthesis selenosugar synthase SenB [Proteobacteria bacterium]|nr:selenoneine biosynthesis selenosugar synthase SenB [Pseudomonadota bacterium]
MVIVSPALADANNGNWQTARRWQRMLAPAVRIVKQWPDALADKDDVMLALHARRSWPSIAAWYEARGNRGLAVVLTGTDLYRDIRADASAKESLRLARRLIVLQERGLLALSEALRGKASVIYPSATARRTLTKSPRLLRAVMVGHLREEKSPDTLFAAMPLLAGHPDIRIDHIGAALDSGLETQAQATMTDCPNYRWLGSLPHQTTRNRIQRAHVLIHCSRMEGGAHVLMEAVMSGTPVLASRVDGNLGMLGEDYAGYFPWGDARGLADLVLACRATQNEPNGLLLHLAEQASLRTQFFAPETERAALRRLVDELSR